MDKVTISEMTPKQCQVLVGKHRVAYVCYGDGMPINWLPRPVTGLQLTEQEKLQVAKQVRAEMATRTKEKNTVADELAAISSASYTAPEVKKDGTHQGPDSQRTGKPSDSKGSNA